MKPGKAIEASLRHLVFQPDSGATPWPTIVAFHGRGTDENDLVPLIQALSLDDFAVISARAPYSFAPGALVGGYAWYEIGEEGVPNSDTFLRTLTLVRRFMSQIKQGYPIDPARTLLLGFSQGTVIAYAIGLMEPSEIRGIAALSGYVPLRSGLPLKLEDLRKLSVFISHGAWDEIIPVDSGRESADILEKAGAEVVYREYQMGHQVTEETLRDLQAWLRNVVPME